ncbi:cytochrome P450 [Aspergillus californicus]
MAIGVIHVSACLLKGLSFLSTCLAAIILYRLWLHPLAHIPGPFLARATGLWRTWRYVTGNWHKDIVALHDHYGKAVRVSPSEVSVVDEETMKQILSHRHNTPKSWWYDVWVVPGGTPGLFAVRDRHVHGFLRKRVSHMFSVTSLLTMEQYIHSCMDTLIGKMKKFEANRQIVDMANWTNAFAFDVIGELGYGEAFGHMETESDVLNLRATVLQGFKTFSIIGYLWGQWRLVLNPVVSTFGPSPQTQFSDYTVGRLQARKSDPKQRRPDLLQHWLQMKRQDGTPAHDDEVVTEMFSIIGELVSPTSHLAPPVYVRLQKEIDVAYAGFGNNDSRIMYNVTQNLSFLQAVIKESARLWPSIVWQLPRDSPQGGITVDGKFFIPEGYQISISPMAHNRDPEVYGSDAKEFRPERWLEDQANARRMESLSATFGGNGPRACLGKNLALMEVQLFLARFMRNFDFEIVDKERPWRVVAAWFASQNEMYFRLKRRDFDVSESEVQAADLTET